jgi:hypothetical protein
MLSVHVVVAIIFVGPLTVAVSLFPRYGRAALAPDASSPAARNRAVAVAGLLHRMSRSYAVLGLSVPVAGIALAARMNVLGDLWVTTSLALTVAAAGLLAAVVLPDQHRIMTVLDAPESLGEGAVPRRPPGPGAVAPGLFAVMWVAVVVLMVARPGSTTGI